MLAICAASYGKTWPEATEEIVAHLATSSVTRTIFFLLLLTKGKHPTLDKRRNYFYRDDRRSSDSALEGSSTNPMS